ncbi:hypothetical protein [Devosia sp.]|uniref:hypothetical protein n=1 Tax=Devosia sp. TaxID=1871048 RepID=UPI003A906040
MQRGSAADEREVVEKNRIVTAVVAVLWVGVLVFSLTTCAFNRAEMMALLRRTPEHQCLVRTGWHNPHIVWAGIRHLRPKLVYLVDEAAPSATLKERQGSDCIAGGDEITYILLPTTAAGDKRLVPVPGSRVETGNRGLDKWVDVLSQDRQVRYRNDGQGYRLLPPDKQSR